MFAGVLLAVITGFFAASAGFDAGDGGYAVAIIGGGFAQVFLLVGLIAKGVEVGNRASR